MSGEQFKLTLHPLPTRPGEPDPTYRLRGALKVLLRRFRFRCVKIDVVDGDEHGTRDGPAQPLRNVIDDDG